MTSPQVLYLTLAVVGAALPLAAFLPWLAEHGLDLALIGEEIRRSRISAFAWADVLVTVVTILVFIRLDAPRAGVTRVLWPVLAACLVGASLALPLYLYLRERAQPGRPSETAPGE
ncbi:hypothetical protein GCM10008955_33660 [Deinococcus malanensis]|uniref:DUF2834 domain-containing protein n=1 Tax=Deinococcus malanensis TaxID=1706855 RepID=A0ABQ2F0A0_9DEIO|nr:DUF2834 domain-containing protein [Deinococcus malanensis]GGK37016.1 hypothetical protein GCM10008955_33660 [Deinococcus malanensis]